MGKKLAVWNVLKPVSSDDANEKGWQCRGRHLSDQNEPDEGMADQEAGSEDQSDAGDALDGDPSEEGDEGGYGDNVNDEADERGERYSSPAQHHYTELPRRRGAQL